MTKISVHVIFTVCLFLILAATGCVAPPKEAASSGTTDLYNPDQLATPTTADNANMLVEATPFQTQVPTQLQYSVIPNPTPIPEDQVCLVDFTDYNMTLEPNRSAKRFDLKNPPMYVNYSIHKPFNITTKRVVDSKSGAKKEETVTSDYYSPYAYLEFTFRNPTTGEIFSQDGFGKTYGYSLNKTIQFSKTGDLLIEINGFNVTPSVGFWIKPYGNFENTSINFTARECRSQDYVKRLNQ
jgi:hypothetical protein